VCEKLCPLIVISFYNVTMLHGENTSTHTLNYSKPHKYASHKPHNAVFKTKT
jgi:hypothetical protein